jgi:beta-1,4-mannosyltransferase
LIPALTHKQFAERLKVVRFGAPPIKILKTHALLFYYAWRLTSLTCYLVYALWFRVRGGPVDLVLVQNPPAVPLLMVAKLYCLWTHAKLVLDWHNLGYTMIELGGPVRAIAKAYERRCGPWADGHLSVTNALANFLTTDLLVSTSQYRPAPIIRVLHDSPPAVFRLRTLAEQHGLLQRLSMSLVLPAAWQGKIDQENTSSATLGTVMDGRRRVRPRPHRPALVVSSTSWTPEEDMGMLLEACVAVDAQIVAQDSSLRIVCLISGKGPLKEMYEERISKLKLTAVVILTLWVRFV